MNCDRVSLTVASIWMLMTSISPPRTADAAGQTQRGPLAAKLIVPAKPLRSGDTALIPVVIKNTSREAIAVAFDAALRSFIFESGTAVASHGRAQVGDVDIESDRDECSGDMPTFLLRAGETIVQLFRIPVPKKSIGRTTLSIVLGVQKVSEPPHCTPATHIDVPASAIVKIGE
jgi:hypothetical protein